jgi:archaeosine synthase beta-subunit
MQPLTLYPTSPTQRTQWIEQQRGAKNLLETHRPYAHFWEEEIGPDGEIWENLIVLLTNTECPFRCVMCDLWQNTLDIATPLGAIPAQITEALQLPPPTSPNRSRAIKLYNAGSFFDPRAIPETEDAMIATLIAGQFNHVIIECHTAFLQGKYRERVLRFQQAIAPMTLEIAIGLETAHEGVLERLNKRMTLEDFARAAQFLHDNRIALRVFILVRPPWLSEEEGIEWGRRSLDLAFTYHATACTLIPTRAGNGAMEALQEAGEFTPPQIASVLEVLQYGLAHPNKQQSRVFADTWEGEKFIHSPTDRDVITKIECLNQTQKESFCSSIYIFLE